MPKTWTPQEKLRLLVTIMSLQNSAVPPWRDVAAKMGDINTWNACRQQYQIIMKEANGVSKPSAGEDSGSATPTKKASATPTSRKRKQNHNSGDFEDAEAHQDDEEMHPKLSKKVKTEEPASDEDVL